MGITTILLIVLISVVIYSLLAFAAGNNKGCCSKLPGDEDDRNENLCCGKWKS